MLRNSKKMWLPIRSNNSFKPLEDEVYVAKETYVTKYATFMTEFIQFCSEIRIVV